MGGTGKKGCVNVLHHTGRNVTTDATNENVFQLFEYFVETAMEEYPAVKSKRITESVSSRMKFTILKGKDCLLVCVNRKCTLVTKNYLFHDSKSFTICPPRDFNAVFL